MSEATCLRLKLAAEHADCEAWRAVAERLFAENERLTKERDEQARVFHDNQWRQLKAAEARVAALTTALGEAADDIESWGAYAGHYFQQKHDLAGCVASYRALAQGDSRG